MNKKLIQEIKEYRYKQYMYVNSEPLLEDDVKEAYLHQINKLYKKTHRFLDELDVDLNQFNFDVRFSHSVVSMVYSKSTPIYSGQYATKIRFDIHLKGITSTISVGGFRYHGNVVQLQGHTKSKIRDSLMKFMFLTL